MSKANQRQSTKHKVYFKNQFDKTPVNKVITMARHIARFNDTKAMSRFKQLPAINLSRALTKVKSLMPGCKHIRDVLILANQ